MGWKWWHWLVSPRRADMWDKLLPRNAVISTVKSDLGCGFCTDSAQSVSVPKFSRIELVTRLIDRRWALSSPDSPIHEVIISGNGSCRQSGGELWGSTFRCNPRPSFGDDLERKTRQHPSFYVVRDDLLHPLVNGNKARKLDAVLPLLEDNGITDVVTCGGCQSAHAAAVAISCAERGLKPHLLLRGEQPEILTGYNLISSLYGNVTYVERSLYARREDMLEGHANSIAGSNGSIECLDDLLVASFANNASKMKSFSEKASLQTITNLRKVAIINEGAADAVGLLASNAALSQVPGQIVLTISLGRIEGAIRLVHYLSQKHLFGKDQVVKIVVDAGTGTTAVGLALGALCLGLPWEVSAVMLADTLERYRKREECLISKFFKICNSPSVDLNLDGANDKLVHWLHRNSPRKFGNILKGEVEECQKIAQKTGILVDPVYTLAAWQLSTQLSLELGEDEKVVMLHTGGTLGMFGLAQRYKPYFQNLKAEVCD